MSSNANTETSGVVVLQRFNTLSDYDAFRLVHATYAKAKVTMVYFDHEIFSGGDSSPRQPGYHAAAISSLVAGDVSKGCVEDGAEKTKGMTARTRGRSIVHHIELGIVK
jgi:hypothetical protein